MARTERKFKRPTLAQKTKALYDFWAFVDLISFHGGSNSFGECHRELMNWDLEETFDKNTKLIIIPRGHLKSTLMSVCKTLWRIYQIPDIRIFVGTSTRPLAIAFVREIRTYLEDAFLIENVWNARDHIEGRLIPEMERLKTNRYETEARDRKIIWSTQAIQVIRPSILKEPTVSVGSVGTVPTGFHFDELVLDDVVTYENISTRDKLTKIKSWVDDLVCVLDPKYRDDFYQTILPLKAEKYADIGGKITVVGTRYGSEDWYNELIDSPDWAIYERNIYKNGHDSSEGYLWHELWDEKLESFKRSQMTGSRFASQYLNRLLAPGASVLDVDLAHFIPSSDINYVPERNLFEVKHSSLPEGSTLVKPYLVVDPAGTVGDDSDFTAIVVGGKDTQGNLIVLDIDMGKWRSGEMLKNIYLLADKWKLNAVWIESVGGFVHFVEFVRSSFKQYRPVVLNEFRPTWVQGKKETRISNALEPLFSNGMVYLPKSMSHRLDMTDQLLFFPRKNVHDDVPDVMAALAEIAKAASPKPINRLDVVKNKVYGGYR
jgi:hypothetical protein